MDIRGMTTLWGEGKLPVCPGRKRHPAPEGNLPNRNRYNPPFSSERLAKTQDMGKYAILAYPVVLEHGRLFPGFEKNREGKITLARGVYKFLGLGSVV